MKKMIFAAAVVAMSAGAASATDLIAYWNFNDQGLPNGGFGFQPGDFPFPADAGVQAGSANITLGGGIVLDTNINGNGDEVLTWVQSFAGSTVNALFGDPSGGSLSIQGGTDQQNNGAFIDFAFDASLYTGINISWAGRGTTTGFGSADAPNTLQWSIDGVNFVNFATYESRQTSFQLYDFSAGGSLDLASNAIIRIVLDGAGSSTGNNRLDNIQITGILIPTPGSVAILGLAGLAAVRRRR